MVWQTANEGEVKYQSYSYVSRLGITGIAELSSRRDTPTARQKVIVQGAPSFQSMPRRPAFLCETVTPHPIRDSRIHTPSRSLFRRSTSSRATWLSS